MDIATAHKLRTSRLGAVSITGCAHPKTKGGLGKTANCKVKVVFAGGFVIELCRYLIPIVTGRVLEIDGARSSRWDQSCFDIGLGHRIDLRGIDNALSGQRGVGLEKGIGLQK